MMSNGNTCDCDSALFACAIIVLIIVFAGEPDLVDSLIFKLTGVQNW